MFTLGQASMSLGELLKLGLLELRLENTFLEITSCQNICDSKM
jgi:hypothetical protein